MQNMPKLSIITVNLNNKTGLEKTIKSVLCQTFSDYEFILIDGNSADGSVEIIKQYQDKINFWVSEPDTGVYNAMNKGVAKATGEYCLFLNSADTLYDETALSKAFADNHEEDILYGDSLNRNILCTYPENLTWGYFFNNPILHQATFIKRNLFEKYGLYDENYKIVADWEFFIKAILCNKCSYHYLKGQIIVAFDMEGMSNQAAHQNIFNAEKNKMLKKMYGAFYDDYDDYWKTIRQLYELKKAYKTILASREYKLGLTLLYPLRKMKVFVCKYFFNNRKTLSTNNK